MLKAWTKAQCSDNNTVTNSREVKLKRVRVSRIPRVLSTEVAKRGSFAQYTWLTLRKNVLLLELWREIENFIAKLMQHPANEVAPSRAALHSRSNCTNKTLLPTCAFNYCTLKDETLRRVAAIC